MPPKRTEGGALFPVNPRRTPLPASTGRTVNTSVAGRASPTEVTPLMGHEEVEPTWIRALANLSSLLRLLRHGYSAGGAFQLALMLGKSAGQLGEASFWTNDPDLQDVVGQSLGESSVKDALHYEHTMVGASSLSGDRSSIYPSGAGCPSCAGAASGFIPTIEWLSVVCAGLDILLRSPEMLRHAYRAYRFMDKKAPKSTAGRIAFDAVVGTLFLIPAAFLSFDNGHRIKRKGDKIAIGLPWNFMMTLVDVATISTWFGIPRALGNYLDSVASEVQKRTSEHDPLAIAQVEARAAVIEMGDSVFVQISNDQGYMALFGFVGTAVFGTVTFGSDLATDIVHVCAHPVDSCKSVGRGFKAFGSAVGGIFSRRKKGQDEMAAAEEGRAGCCWPCCRRRPVPGDDSGV